MRIDVVTIFPAYLDALGLSLPGKARANGLLDIAVHDLRDWTHDNHHTVDDTPHGGGAGMVMKPDVWGEALDAVLTDDAVLVVPTPSGVPFTQAIAEGLATRPHLVFACGRYEGIDQRVMDHYATTHDVREISIGDYVLNGGEVATLAICEAVVRLLPGFMGNAASLREESHGESGLLEYPVFTKPASWRGLDVPAVLTGGDHGAIAAWRRDQAVRRTAERRPDLAHPSRTVSAGGAELELRLATAADAGELLTLQRACWVTEAVDNDTLALLALTESLADVEAWIAEWAVFVLRDRASGRLVGGVRGRLVGETWEIGRLMAAPDLRGRGLGRLLLAHVEAAAPPAATAYELFTGRRSEANLRRYKRAGYRPTGGDEHVVHLRKRR